MNLKLAIVQSNRPQRVIGALAGLSEQRMSDVVRGVTTPTDAERIALSRALDPVLDRAADAAFWADNLVERV